LDDLGNVFGTTGNGGGNDIDREGIGGGTAYELSGTGLKVLQAFCSAAACADGEYPGAVILDRTGNILGTAGIGGEFSGGNIYELGL